MRAHTNAVLHFTQAFKSFLHRFSRPKALILGVLGFSLDIFLQIRYTTFYLNHSTKGADSMRITKRIFAVLLIAIMAFMLSACERNVRTGIIGKWDMDPDFMFSMLKLNNEIVSKTAQATGQSALSGALEFKADGTLILDMAYPAKTEKKIEGQDEPVVEYIYKVVHEEYKYEFKNDKLYVDGRIVNCRLSGKTLALNGNMRTLVVSKAKDE